MNTQQNNGQDGQKDLQDQAANLRAGNTQKDPGEWVTGGEPITGAQRSYLKTLSDEAGVEFDDNITKAGASKKIEELQQQTGRGQQSS